MTANIVKQQRTLNYSKCHFCRRDKKKCEPKDRVWPGQKCERCLMKNLDCSASVSLTGHLTPSQRVLPRDDSGACLPSLSSSGHPLRKANMASSIEEDTRHSKQASVLSDGSQPSTSLVTSHDLLPLVADQNNGLLVQIQDDAENDQACRKPKQAEADVRQPVDRPVDVKTGPNPMGSMEVITPSEDGSFADNTGQSLKRTHEGLREIDNSAPAKKIQTDPSRGHIFACPYWKMAPVEHRTCFSRKLNDCSRVKQHLLRSHTPRYYCQRCMTIFADEEEQLEHLRHPNDNCVWKSGSGHEFIKHEQSNQLSRKSPRSLSEKDKWYQIWDILFSTKQRPASPYIDADLSEEVHAFNEFLQNQGLEIMADMFTAESPLLLGEQPDVPLREVLHRGLSKIWENWISGRQSHGHNTATDCWSRAAESPPSPVPSGETISLITRTTFDDVDEAGSTDLYLKQLVIFKMANGQEYAFEEGQIDTCNDAKFMLVGKHLVKKLGLKEEPLLGDTELLQGVNGTPFRPTSFVRMNFKMPRLKLDWVTVCAYVINGNIGFNLGHRAIARFNLLEKLVELRKFEQAWLKPGHQGTDSTSAHAVNVVLAVRSKAQENTDVKSHSATSIATFREHWQTGVADRPFDSRFDGQSTTDSQSIYAPSIESSSISDTTASIAFDEPSSSRASICLTSNTSISIHSLQQEHVSEVGVQDKLSK